MCGRVVDGLFQETGKGVKVSGLKRSVLSCGGQQGG